MIKYVNFPYNFITVHNSLSTFRVMTPSTGPGSSVGCASAWHADNRGFDPRVWQHSFVEIGHEIISTTILSLPLIQVGQLMSKGCALSIG